MKRIVFWLTLLFFELVPMTSVFLTSCGQPESNPAHLSRAPSNQHNTIPAEETSMKEDQSADAKELKLKSQLEDIRSLNSKLYNKQQEIQELAREFTVDVEGFEKSIRERSQTLGLDIASGPEAMNDVDIRHTVRLLFQRKAYLRQLESADKNITTGRKDLDFLDNKTEADIKMIRVMNPKEAGVLSKQIESVITRYVPFADRLEFEEKVVDDRQYLKLWREVVSKVNDASEGGDT
jgi:hypothetical protein